VLLLIRKTWALQSKVHKLIGSNVPSVLLLWPLCACRFHRGVC
jgi:hypothetical protein